LEAHTLAGRSFRPPANRHSGYRWRHNLLR